MQSPQELRRADGHDMARLQQSLKKQPKPSSRSRSVATKLSPAEIRSLNNNLIASTGPHRPPSTNMHRGNTQTPPLTPEQVISSRHSTPNRHSLSLPTPPHSPDNVLPRRQNSNSGNGMHIHSPTPRSHSKAGFVLTTTNSRPQSASSHRGMPTYRGPEVTKTGSVSMLHASIMKPQIVDNPLSQFSRPRQSLGSISPARQDPVQHVSTDQPQMSPSRSQSLSVVSNSSSRTATPPKRAESPVPDMVEDVAPPTIVDPVEPKEPFTKTIQQAPVDGSTSAQQPNSRFSRGWRRSTNGYADESGETKDAKNRQKTSFWSRNTEESFQAVAYDNTRAGTAPEKRDTLQGDLPSNETSMPSEREVQTPTSVRDFDPHPAVRPLSAQSEYMVDLKGKGKGKELENGHDIEYTHDVFSHDAMPMHSQCSCCGKQKKPGVNRPLSPVLENENLRANLSMEIQRADLMASRRRSSSANRQKYVPILPLMGPDGDTTQAKIALKNYEDAMLDQDQNDPAPVVNGPGDIIASGSDPIALIPKQLEEKNRKVVRFSSLHFKQETPKQAAGGAFIAAGQPISGNLPHAIPIRSPTAPFPSTSVTDVSLNPPTDRPKHQNSRLETLPEVSSGGFMPSLEAIDFSFGESLFGLNQSEDKYDLSQKQSGVTALPTVVPEREELASNEATATDDTKSCHSIQSTSEGLNPTSRTVSFGPSTDPQPQATRTPPGSIHRKSALKRRPDDLRMPIAPQPTHTDYSSLYSSSKGFTTKPKATAQFLMRTDSDTSSMKNIPSYSKPLQVAVRDYSAANSSRSSPTTVPVKVGDNITRDPPSRPSSYLGSRSGSSERAGKTSGESSASQMSYEPSQKKGRSKLVERVLAATSGRHGVANFNE